LVDGSHNKQVKATKTSLTNESLSTDSDGSSDLTALKDRTGRDLNIHSDDRITVSYVLEGKTYTTTATVSDTDLDGIITLANKAKNGAGVSATSFGVGQYDSAVGVNSSSSTVYTASGEKAFTVQATAAGVKNQISGFTISITDKDGNINKSANAVLDAFNETVRAEDDSADNSIVLQVGTKANQAIKVGLSDMRSEALGLSGSDGTKLNISTQKNANAAINVLDNAVQKALDQQTTIGAVQSRLEYTSSNLTTASENVQAAESTIRDADMAKEMTNYTKNNVLLQAAQSMLAQANQSSSSVLSLLQ
jgi:flagellin